MTNIIQVNKLEAEKERLSPSLSFWLCTYIYLYIKRGSIQVNNSLEQDKEIDSSLSGTTAVAGMGKKSEKEIDSS
jgi:hypothetical protein